LLFDVPLDLASRPYVIHGMARHHIQPQNAAHAARRLTLSSLLLRGSEWADG
jgi:hypothetical protein